MSCLDYLIILIDFMWKWYMWTKLQHLLVQYNTLHLTWFELYAVQIKCTEAVSEGWKGHMRLLFRRRWWKHQVITVWMFNVEKSMYLIRPRPRKIPFAPATFWLLVFFGTLVLTMAKFYNVWVRTPCSLVHGYHCFGKTFGLNLYMPSEDGGRMLHLNLDTQLSYYIHTYLFIFQISYIGTAIRYGNGHMIS
jgi:hypothetical protein